VTEKEEYVLGSKVLEKFFGDANFPVQWKNEDEKKLLWWYDDLHVPRPVSPMYADFCGWWDGEPPMARCCEYMYRRFWAPFGTQWPGKIVNSYVFTTVVPRDPEEAKKAGPYYNMIMPVYAAKFLEWWQQRYLPEVEGNLAYLDKYPYAKAPMEELLWLLEEAFDIFERHWRLHWILNLAQFQAFIQFRTVYQQVFGKMDEDEVGRILLSVKDKNWETIEGIWKLKERLKANRPLRKVFEEPKDKTGKAVLEELGKSAAGKTFLKDLGKYLDHYGHKSVFAHELIYPTWREYPVPAIELIRTYLSMDYNYPKDVKRCKDGRDKAVKEMLSRVQKPEDKKKLEESVNHALRMAPLTPDHHFYFDQGTHARVRRVFLEIGKHLKERGIIGDPEDIFYLRYNEMREIAASPKAFDAKAKVATRRKENEDAAKLIPVDWVGTATQWAVYEEPYKQGLWGFPDKLDRRKKAVKGAKELKGLGASPGVIQGTARVVRSPDEFDEVQPGDIMVCRLTNPAWINVFPKIKGLVTDAGGILAHPAIVSREFGIPCVVGTSVATEVIKTGDIIKVDGTKGIVELIGK
jgi:phosphohistidine swiveling domain-containing protein